MMLRWVCCVTVQHIGIEIEGSFDMRSLCSSVLKEHQEGQSNSFPPFQETYTQFPKIGRAHV